MSGRLVILPKKTYCPWNPDNVERVLRDERLERERLEKAEVTRQQEETQQRWDSLKKKNKQGDAPKRFSLFEEEEKNQNKMATHGKSNKKTGVMPVYLGESLSREQTRKAAKEEKEQGTVYQQRVARRKREMDPMREFSNECNHKEEEPAQKNGEDMQQPAKPKSKSHQSDDDSDSESDSSRSRNKRRRKKRRKHKRSRRHRYSSHNSSSSDSNDDEEEQRRRKKKSKRSRHRHRHRRDYSDSGSSDGSSDDDDDRRRRRKKYKRRKDNPPAPPSINYAELRKRRLEREQKEKQRERAAIQEASGGVRSRQYQDQYHPRFSRN